jgi:hypothetical protein
MEISTIITIAVFAVIAIVFIIALVKSFAEAHWLHLALVFLTFVTTITGAIVLSRSYKTRAAWQQKFYANEKAYQDQKEAYEIARNGSPTSTISDLTSLRGASHALTVETFGQGRVWANGTPEVQGENIVVSLPTTVAGDDQFFTNEQPAMQLQQRMLVYAYRDGPIPESAYVDPGSEDTAALRAPTPEVTGPLIYLGILQVVSVEGNKVTLKPSNTLNTFERKLQRDAQGQIVIQNGKPVIESTPIFPDITREFETPSGTWTLFEKVPVDARDAFKRLRKQILNVDPLADTTNIDEYQDSYRKELMQFMPPESFGLSLDQPEQAAKYEAIIDRYAFDQMRLTDINKWITNHKEQRVGTSFDPPTDERFVMLKFQEQSQEYEVDSNTGNLRDNGAFDPQGRAVLNILWATQDGTGKIRLAKDAVVVVDPDSAVRLKTAEKVEDLGEVYVRRLNDFPALTSNYNLERERLFDVLLRLVDEIEKLKVTDADTQAQERQRAQLIDQIGQDIANVQTDVQTIDTLRDARVRDIIDLKEQINRLHKVIGVRYEEIKQRSMQLLNTSR